MTAEAARSGSGEGGMEERSSEAIEGQKKPTRLFEGATSGAW